MDCVSRWIYLDDFIAKYFSYHPHYYRTFLLSDLIIVELGFGPKIRIFDEICKFEKLEEKRKKKLLKAIWDIHKVRNRLAHGEAYSGPDMVTKFRKRKSWIYAKDDIILNTRLAEEMDKKRLFIIQELWKIYKEFSNSKRIESEFWGISSTFRFRALYTLMHLNYSSW